MGFYGNEDYPQVHRLSDPLLIRIDAYSLQVGETTFFAKIKFGQAFRGYLVYASGLNVPIYTYDMTNGVSVSQDYVVQNLTNVNLSSDVKVAQIQELAKGWIDVLQETILKAPEGDSLKSAIDRFNWQIHRDITGSDFDMTELEGFSNVTIDDVNENITIHGVVTDTSNNTKTAINNVATNVSTVSDNVLTVANNVSTVASNLRGEGEHTISKCLRDKATGDGSVSHSVKEQTELERSEFTSIENHIGESTDASGTTTLFGQIYESTSTTATNISTSEGVITGSISNATGNINGNISAVGSNVSNVYTYLTDNVGTRTLGDRSGTLSNKTISDILADVHATMFGHEVNLRDTISHDYRGSYGFMGGPTVGENSSIYVKARVSDSGRTWADAGDT